MPRRRVTIATSTGLHARPAALLTQTAAASGCAVQIGRPGQAVADAASILMVMGLSLQHGDEVEVVAEGENAERALDAVAALLETDLDAVPAAR